MSTLGTAASQVSPMEGGPPYTRPTMELDIRIVDSAEEAVAVAGRALGEELRRDTERTTLLLSGGSASQIHAWLARRSDELPRRASHLELGLVDERWGEVGHGNSNAREARQSGLVAALEDRGARFVEVLSPGSSPEAAARAYQRWLDGRLKSSRVLATVGLGADGHTYGVLPQGDRETFLRLFPEEARFAAYDHPGDTAHRRRLTLTPAASSHLDWVVGLALGESKASVVGRLARTLEEPVHLFPAGLLRSRPGLLVADHSPHEA